MPNCPALEPFELELVRLVLRRHPEVETTTLFSSRAKGTHAPGAAAIAAELEELPLPYRFDVHALAAISYAPLLEHIEWVGQVIYPETAR